MFFTFAVSREATAASMPTEWSLLKQTSIAFCLAFIVGTRPLVSAPHFASSHTLSTSRSPRRLRRRPATRPTHPRLPTPRRPRNNQTSPPTPPFPISLSLPLPNTSILRAHQPLPLAPRLPGRRRPLLGRKRDARTLVAHDAGRDVRAERAGLWRAARCAHDAAALFACCGGG